MPIHITFVRSLNPTRIHNTKLTNTDASISYQEMALSDKKHGRVHGRGDLQTSHPPHASPISNPHSKTRTSIKFPESDTQMRNSQPWSDSSTPNFIPTYPQLRRVHPNDQNTNQSDGAYVAPADACSLESYIADSVDTRKPQHHHPDRYYTWKDRLTQVVETCCIRCLPISDGILHRKYLTVPGRKICHQPKMCQIFGIIILLPYDQPTIKHNWNLFRKCGIFWKGYIYVGSSMRDPRAPHTKGPTYQPPSTIYTIVRIQSGIPQLPGKYTESHILMQSRREGVLKTAG